MRIPNLKEIYESNIDVRDSYIPDKWRNSFNDFIRGSACYMVYKTNSPDYRAEVMGGRVDLTFRVVEALDDKSESSDKEFCYYTWDFKRWYISNKLEIERDIKIDSIVE